MNWRLKGFCVVIVMTAALAVLPARALEPGDDQYPNSIMTPEPGAATQHRGSAATKRSHRTFRGGAGLLVKRSARRHWLAARGSSGSVLPTPLPRTTLIPPEYGGIAPVVPTVPSQQGPTVIPGLNPIPNLPHGVETFQDRASRCDFQAGLYGVPNTARTQYMGACLQ